MGKDILEKGSWWRFDHYEIRDGYVCPAHNANLKAYDPWQDFLKDRQGRTRREPPYDSLLELLKDICPTNSTASIKLSAKSEAKLLDWCTKHGLLGLLPHQARLAVFLPGKSQRREGLLTLVQRMYQKGYEAELYIDASGDSRQKEFSEICSEPGVLTSGYEFKPIDYLERYFPEAGKRLPLLDPAKENFWKFYAEPIEDFIAGASQLRDALVGLSYLANEDGSEAQGRVINEGLNKLNDLLSPVSSPLRFDDTGGFVKGHHFPSLLSIFASMVEDDLVNGRRVLLCEECSRPFVAANYKTTMYCSRRCRNTVSVREWRKRQK